MDNYEDALKYQQIRDAGFNDREITFFDLMSKSEDEICTFLAAHFYKYQIRNTVNTQQRQILSDKIAAQSFLNAIGVKTPTMIGVWHPVFGMTTDGRPLTTEAELTTELEEYLQASDQLELIIKPRDGGSGQYIFAAKVVRLESGEISILSDGKHHSTGAFLDELPEDPRSIISGGRALGWAIQTRVKQHPDMASFNPSSLNTLRIGTFITKPQHGSNDEPEVHLDYACFRVGRAGSNSDNWATGGLLIDIDLETGQLKRGRFAQEFGGAFVDEHPDSKLAFGGLKVPYWDEAIALCLHIAKALPSVRSVGWDVAITEEGPLIIEGNCPWSTPLPQAQNVGYFTPERRARYEMSGDTMPSTTLPPKRALPGQSKPSWAFYMLRQMMKN